MGDFGTQAFRMRRYNGYMRYIIPRSWKRHACSKGRMGTNPPITPKRWLDVARTLPGVARAMTGRRNRGGGNQASIYHNIEDPTRSNTRVHIIQWNRSNSCIEIYTLDLLTPLGQLMRSCVVNGGLHPRFVNPSRSIDEIMSCEWTSKP